MSRFDMTNRVRMLHEHTPFSFPSKPKLVHAPAVAPTEPEVVWGEWTPNTDPATVCAGVTFEQTRTNNIGGTETRTLTGTKQPNWSDWTPNPATIDLGVTFTQTRTDSNGCLPDETQTAVGTKPTAVCGTRLITDQNLIDLLNNSTQVRYQYNSSEGSLDITIPWSSSTVYDIGDRLSPQYPFVRLGLSWNSSTNTLYYTSFDEALLASLVLIPIGCTKDDCSGIWVEAPQQNPSGGTSVNINGISYTCGQYCDLPFTISPTSVSLTFF